MLHITHRSNRASILERGLEPCIDDLLEDGIEGVNLTTGVEHYRPLEVTDIICKVNLSDLDPSKLRQVQDWWWRYESTIKPEWISITWARFHSGA